VNYEKQNDIIFYTGSHTISFNTYTKYNVSHIISSTCSDRSQFSGAVQYTQAIKV